ncbi:hypothetical protein HDU83_005251 [Entophlyctis luteolus]|nr:hypothetical protein HDU83_005251 [Entophlyctis luteolus]
MLSDPLALQQGVGVVLDAWNAPDLHQKHKRRNIIDLTKTNQSKNRWATKKHQELSPHAHVDYIHILDTLDELDKMAVLRKRFVADDVIASAKDNTETLNQLVLSTPAIWDDPSEQLVDRFRPIKCGKWQASYIAADKDQFRQFLTLSELQAYRWRFTGEGKR